MAGYVAQPFFMQLVLQQIATQVVHKIANCDLKVAPWSFETARALGTSMARDFKSTRSPRKK